MNSQPLVLAHLQPLCVARQACSQRKRTLTCESWFSLALVCAAVHTRVLLCAQQAAVAKA
eukprot:6212262-Pleurochrysis_carterae.AAC.1